MPPLLLILSLTFAPLIAACTEPTPTRMLPVLASASVLAVPSAPVIPSSLTDAESEPVPATVERIEVPGDLPAFVVRSADGTPPRAFFLAGICSNAYAYLLGFPEAARRAGGIVSIDGDLPCPGAPGFRSLSGDPEKQHRRLEAALAAAGTRTIPPDGLTVIGSSLGASILERLAAKYPGRYARVAIIASPADPFAKNFSAVRAVVTMSCSLDVAYRMKSAARRIAALGVPATYIEMRGCTHGNLADAEKNFGDLFSFLDAHGRSP